VGCAGQVQHEHGDQHARHDQQQLARDAKNARLAIGVSSA
jgi:hypothetical protein